MNEKLQRQLERQRRIEAVQQQFVSWAGKKESQIKQKLQKSTKNKEEHINKIVKKCKDNEKYLGEKLKNYQNKKKQSLREAWKMTQKYKNDEADRSFSKSKTINNTNSFAVSQFIDKKKIPDDKQNQSYNKAYRTESSLKKQTNKAKDNWEQLNKSKDKKFSQPIRFMTEMDQQLEEKQAKSLEIKLKQVFTRFKHNLAEEHQLRVQFLGEKLEKIQKSRNKRFEMIKKKRENYHNPNEDNHHQKRNKIPNKSERTLSETIIKEKRVRDWSEANKNKRQEFFQNQIQNGNNYLQNSKLKFLKTTIAKKIALSTIQKKLYLQRLKH